MTKILFRCMKNCNLSMFERCKSPANCHHTPLCLNIDMALSPQPYYHTARSILVNVGV